MAEEVKEEKSFEDSIQEDENVEYAFAIIRDKKGNVGLKSLSGSLTQNQIYDTCSALCRNINNQEIATVVAGAMVEAVKGAQQKPGQIILPR